MTVTIHKRDGSTIIVRTTKPAASKAKGPTGYVLKGKRVTLSDAARILDVGLRTIIRHTHGGVIDVAAIRALVPGEPLRAPQRAKANPSNTAADKPATAKRGAATYAFEGRAHTLREWADITGIPLTTLRQRVDLWGVERALTQPYSTASIDSRRRNRNRKVIARIASTFHEVAA